VPALGVFLGLGLGLLVGGKLDNLVGVRLRWLPLLIFAAVARFGLDGALSAGAVPDGLRMWLVVAVYLLFAVILLVNRSLPGLTAAALGTVANGIAIVANGGWMPVWQPSLSAAGLDPNVLHSSFHRILDGPVDAGFFAHGGPLVDMIPIPIPIVQSVASVGDLLLGAGLAFFVFAALVRVPAAVPASGPAVAVPASAARPRGALNHPYVRLATNGPFTAMWLGQVVSSLGDRVHQVALVFLVARATNYSPLALGVVFAAMTVPNFLVGPLAGALVDRWDRKRVMVGSDLIRAGIVCLIPVASGIGVGIVIALVFALAAVSSFFRPARAAALPQVVPDADLLTANSAMWIADTVSDLVGYSLGGLFVAFLGSSLALAFWIDGASYLASAALVAAVVIPPLVRAGAGAAGEGVPEVPAQTSIRTEMAQGWRFLRAETVLLATTIQAAIAEYGIGALMALSPLLIASLVVGGTDAAAAYGFFEMAMGLGLVVGGVVLGGLAARLPKGPAIIVAFTAFGLVLVAFALTGNLLVAMVLAAAFGLANAAFVVPSQTLFQQRTPGEMLGRVVAIRLAVVNGVLAVSMATSGALAQAFAGLAGLAVRPIRRA
jgi:hypothetical protein